MRCHKCDGLVVCDYAFSGIGSISISRCVNCGERIDEQIVKARICASIGEQPPGDGPYNTSDVHVRRMLARCATRDVNMVKRYPTIYETLQ